MPPSNQHNIPALTPLSIAPWLPDRAPARAAWAFPTLIGRDRETVHGCYGGLRQAVYKPLAAIGLYALVPAETMPLITPENRIIQLAKSADTIFAVRILSVDEINH